MSNCAVSPWTVYRYGDADPLFGTPPFCGEHNKGWVCTRSKGHVGLHVASTDASHVCCDAWGDVLPVKMQLPKGF